MFETSGVVMRFADNAEKYVMPFTSFNILGTYTTYNTYNALHLRKL